LLVKIKFLNMANLILVRHGESVWNKLGIWTGITDIDLSEEGFTQAREAGKALQGVHIDIAYVADMKRAHQTYDCLAEVLNLRVPVVSTREFNERDYGIYTGKKKWEVKEEIGELAFMSLRRSWDGDVPGGETLKDVYNRAIPYYEKEMLPRLKDGQDVLISAHGNSLRALIKYLERVSESDIANVEIGIGQVYLYDISTEGLVKEKKILNSSYSP
jgi:2,3-bisphosphoglycerate-dependent phosphoglycerate mutase